ncbi:flagellar hook-associated protein FlgL [Thalassotalea castellviae]|uniref:Flagellar hook-associated protein FlgL n=1 Tax=Thalassotalea castellviae TaxID=3075612 RepID=A0ABU2ZY74_9GAMM|nr:flagellar hook-associated protein FlgL [Thalassotalea sp. W431]MDT0602872.1 flagellar hook-associated protein FlgL [Thalassotalea sp. W431]
MRVSTTQFYYQNALQMSNKESGLNEQAKYLSSGKRVLTAKDDAVQYSTLIGYKEQLAAIEKYKTNITQATNRNSLQEISFSQAEDVMQEIKTMMIQANNGALSSSERNVIAAQAKNSLNQMLDIANTKDENGSYIFAGYQTDKTPFTLQLDNSVSYEGDSGVRELQIGKNLAVATNQPGDLAFLKIPNPDGDFSAIYQNNTSGISINKAVIIDPSTYDPLTNAPNFRFDFTDTTADGEANQVTVTDSASNTLLVVNPYTAGQILNFNGLEVQFDGVPEPGDQIDIEPKQEISVFETIKSAIDWVTSTSNSAINAAEYSDVLNKVNASLNYMSTQRGEVGIRLQMTENQESKHADTALYLAQSSSSIEDLDYAKAVSEFDQAQTALQVAQQSFIQIKDLSLFNYI